MNYMKNKKYIISVTVGIVALVAVAGVCLWNQAQPDTKKKEISYSQKELKTNALNSFFDETTSTKEIKKFTTGEGVSSYDLPFATDGILGSKIESEDASIPEYKAAHEKYLKKLKNTVKKSLSIKHLSLEKSKEAPKKLQTEKIEVKGFYLNLYYRDFMTLKAHLIALSQGEDKTASKELEYKAKVKAMDVLDKNLNRYVNKDEVKETTIIYEKNKKTWGISNLTSFYNVISGYQYTSMDCSSEDKMKTFYEKDQKRILNILETATNKKTILGKTPLKLTKETKETNHDKK